MSDEGLLQRFNHYFSPEFDDVGAFLDDMVEAAIEADMMHRGYEQNDDGSWTIPLGDAQNPDERGSASMPRSEQDALDTDVFGYWPQAIADVFRDWMYVPDGSGLRSQAATVGHGLESIAVAGKGRFAGDINADLINLNARISEQRGRYAEAFFNRYVAGLGSTIANLYALGASLQMSATCQAEVFDRTRANVLDIAMSGVFAMRASKPTGGFDAGKALEVGLVVVGAVAAGVATFGTGTVAVVGAVAGAGAGTASGLLSALGAAEEGSGGTNNLAGSHPNEVLDKIKTALEELDEAVTVEETATRTLLQRCSDRVASSDDRITFDLGRPAIRKATDVDEIYDEKQPEVTKREIEAITDTWLPNVAGYVGDARSGLTSTPSPWTRGDSVGLGSTGPYPEYAQLEATLDGLLRHMQRDLQEGGQALRIAARGIDNADEAADARHSRRLRHVVS